MRLLIFSLLTIFLSSCGSNSVPISNKMDGNFAGCAIGAYVNGMENIASFQTAIDKKLAIVLWYVHWQDAFPTAEANTVYANGSVPLITWEPWITSSPNTLEAIAAGSYESYVREFMQAAKDWGHPLFLRFAHEMNGNWYPWDGCHNGQAAGPENYKQAFIYIYNVRQQVGATNVYLVWCPNNVSIPSDTWNEIIDYYPGNQYVDWIGIDGYNWGYGDWKSFASVFGVGYQSITAITSKPLMIGEFASASLEGNRSEWLTDSFSKIQNYYPRIKAFCWFNINKERDWRITGYASDETAFRNGISDSYYLDSMI